MSKSLLFSLFFCLCLSQLSFSQEPCGTVSPPPPVNLGIVGDTDPLPAIALPPDQIVVIPVVFHVVYNNEEENISVAQLQSQLDVLNEDFMRLNSDANDAWPQAANPYMQFQLAKLDPDGFPTSGITRTYTDSTSFSLQGSVKHEETGGKSNWDGYSYMNVYICDVANLRGYATFPDALISVDGIVIDYESVGRGEEFSFSSSRFNLGRTGTHEVGHWLRLTHIWGDGRCGIDDGIDDTPNSDGPNFDCQIGSESCGSVDMVENYMDYSDDSCMNLFTEDQVQLMRLAFSSRGSRVGILSSNALTDICPGESTLVDITINFDENPQDITWDVKNENGDIIASGGPYDEGLDEVNNIPSIYANSQYTETICVPDACYDFTMYDAFGDGISPVPGFPAYSYSIFNKYTDELVTGDPSWYGDEGGYDSTTSPFCTDCITSTPVTIITSANTDPLCTDNCSVMLTASGGEAGYGASVFWYDGPNGTGNLLGNAPSMLVAPTTTTTYYARREGVCNATADASITIVNCGTSPCPPDNDEIAGATNLLVGGEACETNVIATNVGATNSIENDNEASCSSFDPAGDIWFKAMVPSSGNLTIETSLADDNPIFDTVMKVYSGTSGALIEIACDDNNGTDFFSSVTITGRTPGEVLHVRVWEFGNDLKGNFNICAWSPSSLGVEDNTFNGFTYFPNPIKDVLTLKSPRAIDKVDVFNVLGQRMVSINSQNNVQNIDLSNVQVGVYFVRISIDNQIKTIRVIKD